MVFTIAFLYPVIGSVLSSRAGCRMGRWVGANFSDAGGGAVVGVSIGNVGGMCSVGEGITSKITRNHCSTISKSSQQTVHIFFDS